MNLTYRDFKIGEKLVCVKQNTKDYYGDDRLTIGEKYEITDLDFHFPDRVCVELKGPHYFHKEFIPIECFSDIQYIRRLKLNKILD